MDNPWSNLATPLTETYDANGFLQPITQKDWGTNPYQAGLDAAGSQAQSDSLKVTTGVYQGTKSLQDQMNKYQGFMNNSSYPSFPNSGGFGTQGGYEGGSQSAPVAAAAPQSAQTPTLDPNARGANPWSLTGEASSR